MSTPESGRTNDAVRETAHAGRPATDPAEVQPETDGYTSFSQDSAGAASIGTYYRRYVGRVRGGDVGSLPAMAGLIVLLLVFAALRFQIFTSATNFANLLTQAGAIIVLAMGIGFVLLLGQIDLSAGVIGGVGAATTAQLILKTPLPWWAGLLVALLVGVSMGMLSGFLVAVVGIPSFVVSLAFFLAWQGVLLAIVSSGGTIPINEPVIYAVSNQSLSVTWSWIVVVAIIVAYTAISLNTWRQRSSKGLVNSPITVVYIRSAVIAVLLILATAYLSVNRSIGAIPIKGIPWIVPIVGVLLVLWTFVQSRTAFGRYVYAIGGNAEAARRAGIRVNRIIIACFVISSAMAVLSGIIEASRLSSVTAASGTGNELLFAVAAAVIGGTSLFGGKGKAKDAVIGGLVIALIPNGLGLLTNNSVYTYVITGGVLLIAASVDAITRRRRAGSGS